MGAVLYLLITGKSRSRAPTDLDVLMEVRQGALREAVDGGERPESDVERFIIRALRADLAKRWQTAEQMADRLDAILGKLGQPSGPAAQALARELSARDGAKPPVAAAAPRPSEHRCRSRDPFETGQRAAARLRPLGGAQAGDADPPRLRHGEAVAIGIALDTRYSVLSRPAAGAADDRIAPCLEHLGFRCGTRRCASRADGAAGRCSRACASSASIWAAS